MIKVFTYIPTKKLPIVSLISMKESTEQTHTGPLRHPKLLSALSMLLLGQQLFHSALLLTAANRS